MEEEKKGEREKSTTSNDNNMHKVSAPPSHNLPSGPVDKSMPAGFSGINTGLLRFCIEHSDYKEGAAAGIPERDPADYEFLKAAFKSMEDDVAKMRRCTGVLKKEDATENEKKIALEELQFLVEDIDNANDLHKLNCFEPVLQLLGDASPELRMWAAWIIATVSQNNPEGQQKAIEKGALMEVIKLLKQDQEDKVISKALMALSALIRENDTALEQFLEEGGLKALASVLSPTEQRNISTNSKMKTVFLLAHIFRHNLPSCDTFRELGGMEYLLPLLKDADLDLREKTYSTLKELLQDHIVNVQACKKAGLPTLIQDRVKQINATKGEERNHLETEFGLCKEVYELLRQKRH